MPGHSTNPANYKKISISLIATVYNETESIVAFLESYRTQTLLASEFIIIDAGSTDQTANMIRNFAKKEPQLKIKLHIFPGSKRGQARNLAATKAKSEFLAMADAGCLLQRSWLAELAKEQARTKKPVVGGWFQGLAKSKLEEAIVPYFLQLPRRLTAENFMPTSRSLLIAKKTFIAVGGFQETLELSEDYNLMLRLRRDNITWAFAKKAIVDWLPPKTFPGFLRKIASFAASDIEAGILRPKVISLYARYLLLILAWAVQIHLGLVLTAAYLIWSIAKNYHNCPKSWYYLPGLQVSTDLVIMFATIIALRKFRAKVA
jgi:glycosyltransferase involved in cell wall biosynthesis